MHELPHDTCRCMGATSFAEDHVVPTICAQRDTCARYTMQQATGGYRVPFALWLCVDGFEKKIAVGE